MSFSIIILLNKNLILINKIIKHNYVHDLYCKIKYLNLYLSLSFVNDFVFVFIDINSSQCI
jgi:hypothetical protein